VLELGQLVSGPFAGAVLAWFGARVIKVEPPGGDPVRDWRVVEDGSSMWWRSLGRNKECITLDLRREQGRALAFDLACRVDVVVENFRPGTLERWGLGPERLRERNPGLVLCRISGFGQDGPYASRPGFASICEAIGGLRHVDGFPDRAPTRPNLSMGDSLAGLHAALGTVLALYHRDRPGGSRQGQVVDTAIYEAVFNMMEAVLPEYDRAGVVRERTGGRLDGVVPSNAYACADGQHVVIGGNGDSIFKRLMRAAGRSDLADDPRLSTNAGRVAHEPEIDAALSAWTATLPAREVTARLEAAEVPVGRPYSARDIAEDPHYAARGMFERVDVNGRPLALPAMAPKLGTTPGRTEWAGPERGAHTHAVLRAELGLDDAELDRLAREGVI
jgi:crotonobetainyl-CoA:carnitine CoA-transferase CaiB-like acyl-CoA transferase